MAFEKLYNEKGDVAVLISPGYGAGWSTWGDAEQRAQLLFDRRFISLKLDNPPDADVRVIALLNSIWPDDPPYEGGFAKARVVWVKPGTAFRVSEYDGNESLILLDNDERFIA